MPKRFIDKPLTPVAMHQLTWRGHSFDDVQAAPLELLEHRNRET